MWTPVRLNDGMTFRYGFGWGVGRINDHLIVSHTGNITDFLLLLTVPWMIGLR